MDLVEELLEAIGTGLCKNCGHPEETHHPESLVCKAAPRLPGWTCNCGRFRPGNGDSAADGAGHNLWWNKFGDGELCTKEEMLEKTRAFEEAEKAMQVSKMNRDAKLAKEKGWKKFPQRPGETRKEQVLRMIREAKGRPITQREFEVRCSMDTMSAGSLLRRKMMDGGVIKAVPGVGPNGGCGYVMNREPIAELLEDIRKSEPERVNPLQDAIRNMRAVLARKV